MFQGEIAISVDDKGRLAIPATYREQVARDCDNKLVSAYNPFEEGCLWLFPQSRWEHIRDQVNALNNVKAVHRTMKRKVVAAAEYLQPDGNHRIRLPASQRVGAGIDKRAVLLGMNDKFEIWSEQIHLARTRQTIAEDDISEEMEGLDL